MTLQYRIRNRYEDEQWRHRLHLCEKLLSDAINRWCQTDAAFPTRSVVAAVLYLFSPRCRPFELPPYQLPERLGGIVGTPEDEYRLAWPGRAVSQGDALIASLSGFIEATVEEGAEPVVGDLPSGELARRLSEEIVAQQYVVFHHYQTTRRDINHWGSERRPAREPPLNHPASPGALPRHAPSCNAAWHCAPRQRQKHGRSWRPPRRPS